jgi:hypothetical protein
MDWIEQILHVSPDAGNGSLELLFVVCPIAALLIGLVWLFWIRRRRKKPDERDLDSGGAISLIICCCRRRTLWLICLLIALAGAIPSSLRA